jgi:predicted transcriptional regulator
MPSKRTSSGVARVGAAVRGKALEHANRRNIYEYLLLMPGAHFRSVARFLGLPLSTATYHLNVLLNDRLIRSRMEQGRRRFYPIGERARADLNELYGKHWAHRDLRIRVLAAVRRLKSTRPSHIARALGISRQLAAYHLDRLRDQGLLGPSSA